MAHGILDLVAAYRNDNEVGVLLWNGDGTFQRQATYSVGAAPSSVVIADFNGDQRPDVAVANFKDSTLSVLFNNGDGTLQNATVFGVGPGPSRFLHLTQAIMGIPISLQRMEVAVSVQRAATLPC